MTSLENLHESGKFGRIRLAIGIHRDDDISYCLLDPILESISLAPARLVDDSRVRSKPSAHLYRPIARMAVHN
jgi:hypothetical protein